MGTTRVATLVEVLFLVMAVVSPMITVTGDRCLARD